MELHQLRYFACVAKYESMSKAALELHISQPALSKSIAKLETEMGLELFDRSGGRFSLTDSGRFFKQYADQTVRIIEDGVQATKKMAEGVEESVHIGVFGPQRAALACIDAFMNEYPDIKVDIESKQSFKGQPIMHEFEALFYPAGSSFDSLSGLPYEHVSYSVIVPLDHWFANRESITMKELEGEPLVLLKSTSGVLEKTYALCEEAGFYPVVRAVVTNRVAQSMLVRGGHGIGITDGMLPTIEIEGLSVIKLETDIPDQQLCVAFREQSGLSVAARHFMEFTIDYFDLEQ